MAYFLNLFTPETWTAFQQHGADISGFRERQRRMARERVKPGDIFICYLVRVSRWCGALEITSDAFQDDTPIFADPDPFTIRFKVKPIVLLNPTMSLPILEDEIWNELSQMKEIEKGARGWAMHYRASLRPMEGADGQLLISLLKKQSQERREYPFTERDKRQLARRLTVRTLDGEVAVEVPDEEEDAPSDTAESAPAAEGRQSIKMQARIAHIGAEMGFRNGCLETTEYAFSNTFPRPCTRHSSKRCR